MIRTNVTRHHRPVWRQELGHQHIFFTDFGYWMIGPDPAKNQVLFCLIISISVLCYISVVPAQGGVASCDAGLDVVPLTGWQYYTKAGQWRRDTRIAVYGGQPVVILANFACSSSRC